jgi:hypothetical protein
LLVAGCWLLVLVLVLVLVERELRGVCRGLP